MSRKSQVAATAIAILLALLAAGVILGVSPTGIGQTVTVYPGSETKIVNTITVADGMLINITKSNCTITDPTYTTTVISPMTAEGSEVFSPYSNCLPLGLNLGYTTDVKTNFTSGNLNSGGFNQSLFEMENGLLRFRFSAADTMRIFINETGNFTQLLRLGWIDNFISGQQWDNKTSAKFIDEGSTKKIQINFSTPDGYLIHNVSMSDYSPLIGFEYKWYDINQSKNSTHYPVWYSEVYLNISHPSYTWPQVVRYFDTIRLISTDETFFANQSVGFCNAELWDSTKDTTNFTITVDNACGGVWNITEDYDSTINKFQAIRLEDPYIDRNSTNNPTHVYSFTIIPDQTQTCIGAGTFNMTCAFVPVRERNHTVEMYMEYYYVNQSGGPNATETITKWDWFWVESAPPPGCDTGPACDVACNWLLGHSCDCDEECASGYCFNNICSIRSGPPVVPPAELVANFTVNAPETVYLYLNETTQFKIDVKNKGDLSLSYALLSNLPSNTSLRIVPPQYDSILVGDVRSFLVSATPALILNETVTFVLETSETEPYYFSIDFLVSEAPPIYNTTFLLYRLNQMNDLFNDTLEVINILNRQGYDTNIFSEAIYDINQNISICQTQITTGNYEEAYRKLQALSKSIEDVFIAMEFLSFKQAETPEIVIYIISLELAISITILALLLFAKRPVLVRIAIIFGIVNILAVTLFFYFVQQISPFYYIMGIFIGTTIFFMTSGMLGVRKRFFKGDELYKVFIFTLLYFGILTTALLGMISVSNYVSGTLQIPLISSFQAQGEAYTIPVVTFSRNLEKVSAGPGTVTRHKIPPNTVFNMTIIMDSIVGLDDTLTDYFPDDFTVIYSNGGVVSEYNQFYNNIIWDTSSPGLVTYQILSPANEGRYYFGKAHFNESFEGKSYFVDVVNTTNHISATYPNLGELDGATTTISYTQKITINDWSSGIAYDSDVTESEIFLEIPWISSEGTSITISMVQPYQGEICKIDVDKPGRYSCDLGLEKSADISSLVVEIYSPDGTATIDYVYLIVTLLEPPEVVLSEIETYPDELETGETAEYIFVQVENSGESMAENVNLELVLQHPGGQTSQTFPCGNLASGDICPVRFDNNGRGFEIQQGEYSLYSNISWKYGSNAVIRPVFNIIDTSSGISGISSPSLIRLGNTSRYTVSFDNKWSKSLAYLNISVSCPGLECYCSEISNFGWPYCYISDIAAKNKKEFSFIIYAPGDVDEAVYNISSNVSYINPNNNKKRIENAAKSKLTVNTTYFWKNMVFDFTGNKKFFKATELPSILVQFEEYMGMTETPDELFVEISDPDGNAFKEGYTVSLAPNGLVNISMTHTRAFRPGKYKVKTTATEAGFNYTDEYDFTWGLVSINTRKSIYKPGENATIIIVVLDPYGHLVQNANLTVIVTDPLGAITTYHRDPLNDVDTGIETYTRGIYLVNYTTSVEGNYAINAVSYLEEPVWFDTYFTVLSDYDYDIIRDVPATIDPNIVNLTSNITVISFKNSNLFDITEHLPEEFNVTKIDATMNNSKLTWYNMANNSIVSYEAVVPKESPMLYIIGPAEVDGFVEARPWYLAIDPANLYYGANASGYVTSCTTTEGTLTNTLADDSSYFTQGVLDFSGASLVWTGNLGYIEVRLVGVTTADIQQLHITWNGQCSKTKGSGANCGVAWYNWTNAAYVNFGTTFPGASDATRTVILTNPSDIAKAVNDSGWVRIGLTGYANNQPCANNADHDFINVTAYTPPCPIIDGDPATSGCTDVAGTEWNYLAGGGSCPDNKWLIDDAADDAGSDNDDIDNVWSQDDNTYFSLMLKTAGATPDNNLRIYFDPDEDDTYECYAYTSDGSTVTFVGGAGCGTTGSTYSNAGANGYAEYKVNINYICAAASNCCSSGTDGCTGTSGSTRIYIEDPDASNDRAPDSGYYNHDFSSTCDGPSNPIPEFLFGAIVALLVPMLILGLYRKIRGT